MDTVDYKGKKNMPVDKFLKEIFGAVPNVKISLTVEDFKSYANENIFDKNDLQKFMAIETFKELENFILSPKTQNASIKKILTACFVDKNISYNANALKPCTKNHIPVILSGIFEFEENNSAEEIPPADIETNITPPPADIKTNITAPPPAPAKILEFDLDSMQRILGGCQNTIRKDIDATSFNLTEQMPVKLNNEFYMVVPKNLPIYYGAMAIITKNEPQEISAVGKLQLHEGKTHILLDTKDIDYKIFEEQSSFYIVLFPQAAQNIFESGGDYKGEIYLVETQIYLKSLERARTTLCIDFGTSNTTIGSYGVKNPETNEPEIVDFFDETGDIPVKRKTFPTVVYIKSFNGNKIKYLFGYEALKQVIAKDYKSDASVFYEIKRWINSLDAVENVTDEEGHNTKISHREIIQAYIEHILNLAEQYFNRKFTKLHFTAPVKLKDSFIEAMAQMFSKNGRVVVDAGLSIDEGIAIIYNHINKQMKKNKADKKQKIFIIDCGGGTTDLASCEYFVDTKGYSKKLNIITRFENGDSNFGGNNVTFRILQLLKIKLAQKLQNKPEKSVQDLIDDETKILYEIDKNHYENTPPQDDRKVRYAEFDKEYELAEEFVPTKFAQENLIQRKSDLKRNFYYLWQMAEAYKIEFYRATMDFVSVNFSNAEDRKIGIPDDNKYYLFVKKSADGKLEKVMNPMSGIEITNNEIHRLLYADIYSLLKNVLEPYDTNNDEQELLKYNHYKLSGQSCKITLFNELLKEFIPGKYLRYDDDQKESPASLELKLACINGSIYYMRDMEYGEIKPYITMKNPKLIYDVCKTSFDSETKTYMLKKGSVKIEPTVDIISSDARLIRYVVFSQNGKKKNTIDFEIERGNEKSISTTELNADIARRTNDESGNIGKHVSYEIGKVDLEKENLSSVFAHFAIPSKNGYGFYVYCIKIQVQNKQYSYSLTQEPKYFGFEDTTLETFFDGGR